MTATLIAPAPTAGASAPRVTQSRVLRSEWTKFRSLRSTGWTLLISLALMIGIGALFSGVQASQLDASDPGSAVSFDAIATSLNGITFAQLGLGVLGVLLISGEYSTGMIRSSLTVVPRRLPVLWGKLGVLAAVVLPLSIVGSFASFLLGQTLLGSHGVSITSAGALRSVYGAALYLTVVALIGSALGALLRNTAAGISVLVGVFFVLPPLASLLPNSISSAFTQYLPSNAGAALYGGGRGVTDPLPPWAGCGVLCGYAVVLIGAAAWRLRRTDA